MVRKTETGVTAVAQLLARRWKDNRRYFTPDENAAGVGLRSEWLRPRAHGGLALHWSRAPSARSRAHR